MSSPSFFLDLPSKLPHGEGFQRQALSLPLALLSAFLLRRLLLSASASTKNKSTTQW